jgi:hypothetical protein
VPTEEFWLRVNQATKTPCRLLTGGCCRIVVSRLQSCRIGEADYGGGWGGGVELLILKKILAKLNRRCRIKTIG